MSRSRCFQNPFPDYEGQLVTNTSPCTSITTKEQKTKLHEKCYQTALEALENGKTGDRSTLDGGIYVGPIGLTYMYIHLVNIPNALSPQQQMKLQPMAHEALENHWTYYAKIKGSERDLAGFLLGKSGFHAISAVFGKLIGNEELVKRSLGSFGAMAKICKVGEYDELFNGRAGYLCGVLWLQKQMPLEDPVPKQDIRDIWKRIIDSGIAYALKRRSPCPLMYSYYETEYLGAAHGISSILQILLSFPEFCQEFPNDLNLIRQTLDYYLSLQQNNGNFPSAMDEVVHVEGRTSHRSEEHELCHWCHGAPGSVYLFAKAYLYFGDEKYLTACRAAGDYVWKRGLLKKGPGICHGVAGNGYVFLLLHRLTKGTEPQHIYRALKFAEFIDTQEFKRGAKTPDCPFSLYEGIGGAACYFADLLEPNQSEFPFFDVFYNYNVIAEFE